MQNIVQDTIQKNIKIWLTFEVVRIFGVIRAIRATVSHKSTLLLNVSFYKESLSGFKTKYD